MHHRWAALALVLALCALPAKHAAGQRTQPRGRKAGALGPNFPNPFNPATTIPFRVGDTTCVPGSERHVVSLRIYNVLTQLVGIPTLQGAVPDSTGTPVAVVTGQPVTNLALPCGAYMALWNGRYVRSAREAAAGIYVVQLVVDGEALPVRKMMMAR